jgi:hypothetical protein
MSAFGTKRTSDRIAEKIGHVGNEELQDQQR